jgi:hypothetical protein
LKVIVCSGYSIDGPAQEVPDKGAKVSFKSSSLCKLFPIPSQGPWKVKSQITLRSAIRTSSAIRQAHGHE